MTDLALVVKDNGLIDLNFNGGDFDLDEGLESAVLVSLFVDARATVEQLPYGETSLRGYWGDIVTAVEGDITGSLLWLLNRQKTLNSVASKAKEYAARALQWLIDDDVAKSVGIEALIIGNDCLRLDITISRPEGDESLRYDILWQAQKLKRVS